MVGDFREAFSYFPSTQLAFDPPTWPQYSYAHPHVVVLAPTRELCHQIYQEADQLGSDSDFEFRIFCWSASSNTRNRARLAQTNPQCICRDRKPSDSHLSWKQEQKVNLNHHVVFLFISQF